MKLISLRPWRGLMYPPEHAECFEVKTEDGLTLCLRRVRARTDGAAKGASTRTVMLLHGLAANHRGLHFRGCSLADWLAGRGFDVWLPELRGHGDSQCHGHRWVLDDYLRYDLPALLGAIRERSGSEQVSWVGHSMGGILLFCYAILNPDAPIARAVTIGSAVDFKVGKTGFAQLLHVRGAIERFERIPYRRPMRALAPLVARGVHAIGGFNAWAENIDPLVHREIYANCMHDIPTSLLSSLATTFEPSGLRMQDGFCFLQHLEDFHVPTRMLGGSRDEQVPAEAVAHSADLLGEHAYALIFGPDSPGAQATEHHYGHWDLIIGRRAPLETWPAIAAWLESA